MEKLIKNLVLEAIGFSNKSIENYINYSFFDNEQERINKILISFLNNKDIKTLSILGNCGIGKTFITSCSLCAYITDKLETLEDDEEKMKICKKIKYTRYPVLIGDIHNERIQSLKDEIDRINYYSSLELLVIDELYNYQTTEYSKQVIERIIHERYENDETKKTILISNFKPEDYLNNTFSEPIFSRICNETDGIVRYFKKVNDYRLVKVKKGEE